jgi:hypothetical protein
MGPPENQEVAMSKVVHISEQAHGRAKDFCRRHQTPMSDWVNALIEAATDASVPAPRLSGLGITVDVVKKKRIDPLLAQEVPADGVQAYASPPFWLTKARPHA